MEQENGQNIKNAMCYIPWVACILVFTEEKKSLMFKRHIRYWIILFVVTILLSILFRSVFIGVVVIAYLWISWYLGYKAYIGEDVFIRFIDDIFETNKKKKNNKNDENNDETEEIEEIEESEDVLSSGESKE